MNTVVRRVGPARVLLMALMLLAAVCLTSVAGLPVAEQRSGPTPGVADGYLPDGTRLSVNDQVPAVTALDPALLAALRQAAGVAEAAGVPLRINSGWRSPAYQQWLSDQAVDQYGSEQEARRWVATPERSRHTTGDAVDVGPPSAAAWLGDHGGRWGLCRVFDNEPWHFELVGTAGTCPGTVADAAG